MSAWTALQRGDEVEEEPDFDRSAPGSHSGSGDVGDTAEEVVESSGSGSGRDAPDLDDDDDALEP